MTTIKFSKMNGCGNDFIVINDLEEEFCNINKISDKLCDRHFGIGGDGILLVRKSKIADVKMLVINADGSYAAMCGNGIRCFAKYVYETGICRKNTIDIETGDGVKKAVIYNNKDKVENVKINMGKFSFKCSDIFANCDKEIINKEILINNKKYIINSVLMGVPHTVIFGKLSNFDIHEGKLIEKYKIFKQGTNVNFVEVIDKNEIKVKTYERGVGPTLACGTGCCASVVIGNKLKKLGDDVIVNTLGGRLRIEIKDNDVYMTGNAVTSFRGECEI